MEIATGNKQKNVGLAVGLVRVYKGLRSLGNFGISAYKFFMDDEAESVAHSASSSEISL